MLWNWKYLSILLNWMPSLSDIWETLEFQSFLFFFFVFLSYKKFSMVTVAGTTLDVEFLDIPSYHSFLFNSFLVHLEVGVIIIKEIYQRCTKEHILWTVEQVSCFNVALFCSPDLSFSIFIWVINWKSFLYFKLKYTKLKRQH